MKAKRQRSHACVHALSLAILFLPFVYSACDTADVTQAAQDSAVASQADVITELASNLALNRLQTDAVKEAMGDASAHEPGQLWYVASELQKTLTDDQLARLVEMAEQSRQGERNTDRDAPGSMFDGPQAHGRMNGRRHDDGEHGLRSLLDDAQRAAISGIRNTFRPQFEALVERMKSGAVDDETFRSDMHALHDEMKAEIDGVLTDEQRAELEQRHEERKAHRERAREQALDAMVDALALTAEQEGVIRTLFAEHGQARVALRERVRSGEADHETARTWMQDGRGEFLAALTDLLNEDQYTVVQIHDALRHVVRRPGQRPDSNGLPERRAGHGPGTPAGGHG